MILFTVWRESIEGSFSVQPTIVNISLYTLHLKSSLKNRFLYPVDVACSLSKYIAVVSVIVLIIASSFMLKAS